MEWTNKLISEFINLYQKEPSVWNATWPEHRNRIDAYDAWSRIRSKMKDGTIPIKELKRKRDNLMATYRKQRTKVLDSMAAGDGTVYKPAWPFYSVMSSFLDNVYNPRKRKNSEDSQDTDDNAEDTSVDDYENEKVPTIDIPITTPKKTPKKRKTPDSNDIKKRTDEWNTKDIAEDTSGDECDNEKGPTVKIPKPTPKKTPKRKKMHESNEVKKRMDEWETEDIAEHTSMDDYDIDDKTITVPKTSHKKTFKKKTIHENNDVKKRNNKWDTEDIEEDTSADDYEIKLDPLSTIKKPKTLPLQTKKRKLHEYSEVIKRIDEVYDCYKEITRKPEPDTCSLYCDLLCNKLRSLNEGTRDIAMMKIDRLIYDLKHQDNPSTNGPNCYSVLCTKTESLP